MGRSVGAARVSPLWIVAGPATLRPMSPKSKARATGPAAPAPLAAVTPAAVPPAARTPPRSRCPMLEAGEMGETGAD